MAIVRCGAKEQAMLELWCDKAQHTAEIAVLPKRRRHQVVAFIDNKKVPRQMRRSIGRSTGSKKLIENVFLPKIMV
jgi:hypothetical protein